MAEGVPENDIFAAADAVFARGERPTLERVRQELGWDGTARRESADCSINGERALLTG